MELGWLAGGPRAIRVVKLCCFSSPLCQRLALSLACHCRDRIVFEGDILIVLTLLSIQFILFLIFFYFSPSWLSISLDRRIDTFVGITPLHARQVHLLTLMSYATGGQLTYSLELSSEMLASSADSPGGGG
ncbi:uncharacterized protein BO95DRAFT_19410 [Aspergillus brunneoviolaceus CBS 621.78]|uniref:Uncharacterized protein n=1 Tax=Aspergillus brunneoviolaceus CBS 621.78 TaxID=1450534 RepID=A0ACD1FTY1_9EURO|nr:hypothetical protein BO95DRAFT_19410 [Aspergillus brunneoviolaceus CBS 621.78]RAH40365.1 hypothetical protein BO95DRAFT_19410 [Aspergillus brunneoviolaceus CBS 621.78]